MSPALISPLLAAGRHGRHAHVTYVKIRHTNVAPVRAIRSASRHAAFACHAADAITRQLMLAYAVDIFDAAATHYAAALLISLRAITLLAACHVILRYDMLLPPCCFSFAAIIELDISAFRCLLSPRSRHRLITFQYFFSLRFCLVAAGYY